MKSPVARFRQIDWWRRFSGVYFVLQYAVVHLWFFGPTLELIKLIPKIITAFRWDEILAALWNFRNVFIAGLTMQSVFVMLVLFIPYSVILLWAAKFVILYLFVLFQFIWYFVIKFRQYRHERRISLNNVVVVKIGAPGSGKSSSGLYEAVVMARKMWTRLKWKHYCYSSKVNQWRKEPDRYRQKLIEWDEIKFSYKYYTTPQKVKATLDGNLVERKFVPVPCLMSNIPVMVKDKWTSFVGKEHAQQRIRLPGFSVLFLDEAGAMFSVDTAKQRMSDSEDSEDAANVSDFFRLCRHFGDFRVICTEQDSENIYIDVRRVVSKNEYMLSQRWVLKPYLFLALFLPLRGLALRVKRGKRFFAPSLMFLEKLCSYIGFRKYRYLTENNTERAAGMETGKRTFYLPSMLNFRYDERTFRNFYKCKDQVIEPHIFKNLVLDDTDIYKKMFLRSEKRKNKRS